MFSVCNWKNQDCRLLMIDGCKFWWTDMFLLRQILKLEIEAEWGATVHEQSGSLFWLFWIKHLLYYQVVSLNHQRKHYFTLSWLIKGYAFLFSSVVRAHMPFGIKFLIFSRISKNQANGYILKKLETLFDICLVGDEVCQPVIERQTVAEISLGSFPMI